nr:hypothetical protein I308_04364 [Cryptococcus tetragattii IND107]
MRMRMMGMMNSCSLPTYTLEAKWTDQARWQSKLGSGLLLYVERLRELVASPGKVEAQVDSCAPSAAQIPADNFNGFPPPGGNANFEDWPIDLFHPIAEYTKGMIDWDAAQKMDASYTPSYADVPSDPA